MSRKQQISAALLGIIVAIIMWLTILGRESQVIERFYFHPFHSCITFVHNIQRGGIRGNFLGNIVIFIPIGFLLPMVLDNSKWWHIILIGSSFSFLIEIVQLITAKGCFDPDDILLNSMGTVIGWAIWHKIISRRTKLKQNEENDYHT